MVDIAEKLFPNLLTLLTQLASTGVLYWLYRKYLHEPVVEFFDRQANKMTEAEDYAEEVQKRAEENEQEVAEQRQASLQQIETTKSKMMEEAERQRQELINQANEEKGQIVEDGRRQIEDERTKMVTEVEDHLVTVAMLMSQRALENYEVSDEQSLHSLEKELEKVLHERN